MRAFFFIILAAVGCSVQSAEEPILVLGTPQRNPRPAITGLAALPGGFVVVDTAEFVSTVELSTGKATAKTTHRPFTDRSTTKRPIRPTSATNRGSLALNADGKSVYCFDALGVHTYALPLGDRSSARAANNSQIVPLLGVTHAGAGEFPFALNGRGEFLECKWAAGTPSNLAPTNLPRVKVEVLDAHVPAMAGSPRYAATGGMDGRIQIWDATDKTDLNPIGVATRISGLSISHDCKWIASISRGGKPPANEPHVQVFSLPDGKEVASWVTAGQRLALSPDGSALAVVNVQSLSSRTQIEIRDTKTGKVRYEFETPKDAINCFDFTPDGKALVAAGSAGAIHQWSLESGRVQGPSTDLPPAVTTAAFRDNGGFDTIHSDGTFRHWSAAGREEFSFVVHDKEAVHVVGSRDGRMIFSSGSKFDGTIRAYDAATGKELRRLSLPGTTTVATKLALSPDGKHLYAGVAFEGILRIDVETFKIVARLRPENPSPGSAGGAALDIVFTGDATMVVQDFDSLRTWNLKDDREVLRVKTVFSNMGVGRRVASLAVSPDGNQYLSPTVYWSHQRFTIHKPTIVEATAVEITNSPREPATAAAYVSQSLAAVGGATGRILLVKLTEKKTEGTLIGEHLGPVTCLVVSSDGKRLISGSADGSAKVWKLP